MARSKILFVIWFTMFTTLRVRFCSNSWTETARSVAFFSREDMSWFHYCRVITLATSQPKPLKKCKIHKVVPPATNHITPISRTEFVGDISIVNGFFVTQVITYYGGTTLQERLVGFCTKKHGGCRANHKCPKSPLVDFSEVEGLPPNNWWD